MSRTIFKHHQETIDRVADEFRAKSDVLAVIVGGSVAHGFATETSDVDVMLLVDPQEYESRLRTENLTYVNHEICTYQGGYVDGKYITTDFLRQVAEKGSEPARFAFKDAFVVFSRIEGLEGLLAAASRYPVELKEEKIRKFYAQFEAWRWFIGEAKKIGDSYLLTTAVANYTLFAGRLILAHNEELYPYHKWFIRVLGQVKDKPEGLIRQINLVLQHKDDRDIDTLYSMITEFRDWGCDKHEWANRFLLDTELGWMRDAASVADL